MTETGSDFQEPLQSLLELLEEQRVQQCNDIRTRAENEARRRVQSAYREARLRVHRAIEEERIHARQRLDAARARLETRNRQHYQEAVAHTLRRAWHSLEKALRERWHDADGRAAWVDSLVERALARLPAAPWQVEHAPGWDGAELTPWQARIRERSGQPPELKPVEELSSGLRICAGGACLDGSARGLLADRPEVEARLLSYLEEAQE